MPLATPPERLPWSTEEVHWVVADYPAMLTLELTGQPYDKTARRNALLSRLDEAAVAAVQRPAALYEEFNFKDVQTPAPKPDHQVRVKEEVRHDLGGPIRRDYREREARNRSLGLSGELLALQFEQRRLKEMGAADLAGKVEHVAATRGDGLGYDILSFDADGREHFVEVTTTALGQTTPFFVTANEASFARDHASRFKLYRFYEFRARPRTFQLAGAIEQHCRLDPSTFRAQFQ